MSNEAHDQPRLPKLKLKLNTNTIDNINPSQENVPNKIPQSTTSKTNTPNSINNILKKPNNNNNKSASGSTLTSSKSSNDIKSLVNTELELNLNLVKPLKINLNKNNNNNSSLESNTTPFQKANPNTSKPNDFSVSFHSNNRNGVSSNSQVKNKKPSNEEVELGEIIRPKSTTPFSSENSASNEQTPKLVIKPFNKQNQSNSSSSVKSTTHASFAENKLDSKLKKNNSNLNSNILPQFRSNSNPHDASMEQSHPHFNPQDPNAIQAEAMFLLTLAQHAHSQMQFSNFSQLIGASPSDLTVTGSEMGNPKKRKQNFDNNSSLKSSKVSRTVWRRVILLRSRGAARVAIAMATLVWGINHSILRCN